LEVENESEYGGDFDDILEPPTQKEIQMNPTGAELYTQEEEQSEYQLPTSWKPTKKWFTALYTGLTSIGAVWLASGSFDVQGEEGAMLATLIVSLVGAYLKRNDPTPGGVPSA
jgi:hypothetical protein